VASTSIHTVASGISRRDREKCAAAARPMRSSGTRRSVGASDVDGATDATGAGCGLAETSSGAVETAASSVGIDAPWISRRNASTSRRITRWSGPEPSSWLASNPCSRAMRRTMGETTGERRAGSRRDGGGGATGRAAPVLAPGEAEEPRRPNLVGALDGRAVAEVARVP